MTFTATTRSRARGDAGSPRGPTRPFAWALHVLVCLLALFSTATNRFDLWVDLRMLGGAGIAVVKIFWVATALLVPLCAGPWLRGLHRPLWVNRGFAPGLVAMLLWPTYCLIACLAANTVYYFVLLGRGNVEPDLPITAWAAILLSAWVLLSREWLRRSRGSSERTPTKRSTQLQATAFTACCALALSAFFFLHTYGHAPEKPVDLAVVLGSRVLPDGTASPALRDRALAAVDLYNRGLVKHILLSGAVWDAAKPGEHQRNETSAMYQVCIAAGIPDDAISFDPVGLNTRATAYITRLFMQKNGYSSVVACSTDFHLYRTAMSFRSQGIEPYTVAAKPIEWICAKPRDDAREGIGILVYTLDANYRAPKAETMKLEHPRVVVSKSGHTLQLFDGNARVKTYACISGGNAGDKEVEGDRKTPIGTFHIVYKNPQSKFHLSLGLDYPNTEDAQRGLAAGLISKEQHAQILAALRSDLSLAENQDKLWKTPLGGEIFLHGHAEGRTGTAGCVAMANNDIEELYAILPVGTEVQIAP